MHPFHVTGLFFGVLNLQAFVLLLGTDTKWIEVLLAVIDTIGL